MVVVDANVLLYAVNEDSPHHEAARSWLDEALTGTQGVGLPWMVLLAFLRVVTNERILPDPLSVDDALEQVRRWVDAPASVTIEATARHLAVLAGLLGAVATGGNLVNDAHLAALAVEHGATLVSYDRDFGRFDGLRVHTPS
jgi:uncharacterized protein